MNRFQYRLAQFFLLVPVVVVPVADAAALTIYATLTEGVRWG